MQRTRETLRKFKVPIATEPSFVVPSIDSWQISATTFTLQALSS